MQTTNTSFKLLITIMILSSFLALLGCTPSLSNRSKIKPGTYSQKVDIKFRGFRRHYRLHIPDKYDKAKSYPLVIVIHGAFSTAEEFEEISGFSTLADEEGFIVAYPNGIGILGFLQHWNGGHCCGMAAEKKIDDVGYLQAVISDIKQHIEVDPDRIYMAGFSNGGMLAYRFASEHPHEVAAVASVSSTVGSTDSQRNWDWQLQTPAHPVPILIAHGLEDESIPYHGGKYKNNSSITEFFPVERSVRFWIEANNCRILPDKTRLRNGLVEIKTWQDSFGTPKVVLYTIRNWNHRWPGLYHTQSLPEDHPLHTLNLTKEIWDFFKTRKNESR